MPLRNIRFTQPKREGRSAVGKLPPLSAREVIRDDTTSSLRLSDATQLHSVAFLGLKGEARSINLLSVSPLTDKIHIQRTHYDNGAVIYSCSRLWDVYTLMLMERVVELI
ncbi:hypothetical protein CEXT_474551 [Caerostris extrusa]|uniref:Uncharacterized protein n=1 Tax=Caerostris extrusa TaxID=172846 RepID=A0AAV4NR55_CAEEX|nr:hypothetical protein CEXT_474551 [Caerostris extrusa]